MFLSDEWGCFKLCYDVLFDIIYKWRVGTRFNIFAFNYVKNSIFSFVCIIMISLFWERSIINNVPCYREPTVRVISDLISIKFIKVVFNENKPSFGQKEDWFSKLFNNPSCACMLQQPTRSIKVLSPASLYIQKDVL